MPGGTLYTLDSLAALNVGTVAQFGEDRAFEIVDLTLQAHNAQMREMLGTFTTPTTEKLMRYGGDASDIEFDDLDQFGTAYAAKASAGSNVGFPLRLRGKAVQWTRKYMQITPVSEFAKHVNGILDADTRRVIRDIKRGLFYSTNSTFKDKLMDGASLPIKALVNADSFPIPPDPEGNSFNAATHTHYNYTAGVALALADFQASVLDVVEHFADGNLVCYINKAQETAVRGLSGFQAYTDPRVIIGASSNSATRALDVIRVNNRAIGLLDGAEVWVKPWIPSGYLLFFMLGLGQKALAYRTRPGFAGDLEMDFEDESYPLRARQWGREYGISVWNRVAAAVLYIDTGAAAAYVAPTIN